MSLHRVCILFLGVLGIASLTATLAGRPESWWVLALLFGSAAGWYLTRLDPLKGSALALMALRAVLVVLADMCGDFASTFADRWAGRWQRGRTDLEDWD